MPVLYKIIIACLCHIFFAIFLTGNTIYLNILANKKINTSSLSTIIIKSIATGIIYNFYQFILIIIFLSITKINHFNLVIIKYTIDILLITYFYLKNRKHEIFPADFQIYNYYYKFEFTKYYCKINLK